MRVQRIGLRDFRNYAAEEAELAEGLTVVAGANGAGKTNLLEALYFGCTARSPRTSNERELGRTASRWASSPERRSTSAWTGALSTTCRRWRRGHS